MVLRNIVGLFNNSPKEERVGCGGITTFLSPK
jgi:hypothetical protein